MKRPRFSGVEIAEEVQQQYNNHINQPDQSTMDIDETILTFENIQASKISHCASTIKGGFIGTRLIDFDRCGNKVNWCCSC